MKVVLILIALLIIGRAQAGPLNKVGEENGRLGRALRSSDTDETLQKAHKELEAIGVDLHVR